MTELDPDTELTGLIDELIATAGDGFERAGSEGWDALTRHAGGIIGQQLAYMKRLSDQIDNIYAVLAERETDRKRDA